MSKEEDTNNLQNGEFRVNAGVRVSVRMSDCSESFNCVYYYMFTALQHYPRRWLPLHTHFDTSCVKVLVA